jgi:replicative DNA helicase
MSNSKRKTPDGMNQYPKNTTQSFPNELSGGLIPPQSTDIEEVILGAILIESKNCIETIDLMKSEFFYKPAHATLFTAIKSLHGKREPIDIVTVVQELKKNNELDFVGGAYFIAQITNRVASSANIEAHSRIVIQQYIRREIILSASTIIKKSYDDSLDTFELIEDFSRASSKIEEEISQGADFKHITSVIDQEAEAYLKRSLASQKDELIGVDTGFTELNKLTGGWQTPDLIILAARPAMGKTALALKFAREAAAKSKINVGIFSLEMSDLQLVQRLIISEAEVNSDQYKFGVLPHFAEEQVIAARKSLRQNGIYIDDTPSISIPLLRSKVRKMMRTNPLGLLIVDYLQLVTTGEAGRKNREQEISYISSSLKAIAKEFKIPVIALSQLSRAVEQRGGDKKPQLSDLRESGAIEQDADMVMFIHRPEYYGITQDENGESTLGKAELIIAKHRNGAVGELNVTFIAHLTKFTDPYAGESLLSGGNTSSQNGIVPNDDFLNQKNDWSDQPF